VVKRSFEVAGLKQMAIESAEQNCCATSSCGSECASVNIFIASARK